MKLIFIIGIFWGETPWEVENNIRAVENVGYELVQAGYIPVMPHTMYRYWDGTVPNELWIKAAKELMIRCDAVLLMPNWRRGSDAEALLVSAKIENMLIFKSFDTLKDYKWHPTLYLYGAQK